MEEVFALHTGAHGVHIPEVFQKPVVYVFSVSYAFGCKIQAVLEQSEKMLKRSNGKYNHN